jgi:hypothetical protein
MSEHQELATWWAGLTETQRAELLPLQTGDPLRAAYVAGLTDALGVGPAGAWWVESEDGPTFRVDDRIGDYLAAKREES